MWPRLTSLPLFVILMGCGSAAMLIPALHALVVEDFSTARMFFYGALLGLALTLAVGIATRGYDPPSVARSQLIALTAAFSVLPLLLGLPVWMALPRADLVDVWFEMVSSITTTGATLWDNPYRLPPSVHLWRALVGWMGGLLVWVAAVAMLAPLNLGGFEVRAAGTGGPGMARPLRIRDPSERLARFAGRLLPVYAGLTALLWLGLTLAGDPTLVALCHAMSVMATSGISPIGGLHGAASGFWGEVLIFGFLCFALSRLTFSRGLLGDERTPLWRDGEMVMAGVIVGLVTLLLFGRHFLALTEDWTLGGAADALAAFWGAMFTSLSFLTTTGFESRTWLAATDWSGLNTPGLILLGLAIIGGGVATTAGGLKLLRAYALFRHGQREVERLVHPASVGGSGADARRLRRQGAYIAWICFMLFTLSIIGVMFLLSLIGLQFEPALVLSVAALTTAGPLAQVAAENPVSFAGIPDMAKVVLAGAMVLGRLETLALIALFNPDFWRR
jgi:trk system potassium uptake protein